MHYPQTLLQLVLAVSLAGCAATPANKAPAQGAPKIEASPAAAPVAFDSPPPAGTRVRCPVAGETFTVTEPAARFEHKGKHYVLCCAGCLEPIRKDPGNYLGGAP